MDRRPPVLERPRRLSDDDVKSPDQRYGPAPNSAGGRKTRTSRARFSTPRGSLDQEARTRSLRRLGTPDDVAQAARFLSSAASGGITGAVLDVAGGSVMT